MSGLTEREHFSEAVRKDNPSLSPAKVASAAGQVYRFVCELREGDPVVTYNTATRRYAVGRVDGPYGFRPDLLDELPHARAVAWSGEVERDRLSTDSRNALGAFTTIFLVSESAASELTQLLSGSTMASPSDTGEAAAVVAQEQVAASERLKAEQDKAIEFVKDRIAQLDWEEMQDLVAGLLRAMGYKTRVSRAGPDQGKDIVASPDGFGFENPRIVCEVKHRPGAAIGSKEIRGFLGADTETTADCMSAPAALPRTRDTRPIARTFP
ncbi:MAG: restriction endonuclease [Burkholderiaceae bacterium]